MLPTVYDKTLISQSWDDFMDCLRYSIYFKVRSSIMSPLRGQHPDFDPDYAVRKARAKSSPLLDQAFKFGILKGARALAQEVSKMPWELKTGGLYQSLLISPLIRQIRDYLNEHQLVVLVTDKNLGCAIAPWTWIIDKTKSLLESPADYELLDIDKAVKLMREKVKAVQGLPSQYGKFFVKWHSTENIHSLHILRQAIFAHLRWSCCRVKADCFLFELLKNAL